MKKVSLLLVATLAISGTAGSGSVYAATVIAPPIFALPVFAPPNNGDPNIVPTGDVLPDIIPLSCQDACTGIGQNYGSVTTKVVWTGYTCAITASITCWKKNSDGTLSRGAIFQNCEYEETEDENCYQYLLVHPPITSPY